MAAGFILNHNQRVIAEKTWLNQRQVIFHNLDEVASLNLKAESVSRSYLLTGDKYYLKLRDTYIGALRNRLIALREQLKAEEQVAKLTEKLGKAITARIDLSDRCIAARNELDNQDAMILVKHGATLDEEIEDTLASLEEWQSELVSKREAAFLKMILDTNQLESLLGLLCLSALTISISLTYRYMSAKRMSDLRFHAIFDQTYQLIGLLSSDGKIVEANRTALDMVGKKAEDVRGLFFWESPWWEHSNVEQEKIKDAIRKAADGQFVRFQTIHRGLRGNDLAIDFSIKPVFDETGKVLYLLPEGRDMTEQRRLQEMTKASEEHLKSVLTCLAEGVIHLDLDGTLVYMNGAAERLLQYEESELKGRQVYDILGVPDLGKRLTAREELFRRKDGSAFPVDYVASPLVQEGETIGAVVAFQDITLRKEAERRVSEFYSTVSHELRTPLTSIRGALRLLEAGKGGGANLNDRGKHLVAMGLLECDRLIRLINDMLDLRKIEAGKLTLRYEELDSQEETRKVALALQAYADECKVTLETEVERSFKFMADPDRFAQILTNLISNAIKFSPVGGTVKVTVEPILSENGKEAALKFSVADNGPGIDKQSQRKLFKVFQQLDSTDTRGKGGTGLGLAISKSLVEQHGGTIGLESEAGKGAIFWFTLPPGKRQTHTGSQLNSGAQPRLEQIVETARFKKSLQVASESLYAIVVEDDRFTRNLLEMELRRLGLEVICTETGQGCLSYFERPDSFHIELLVLDMGLPDMDGQELIDELLARGKKDLPLIVYTARDLSNEARERATLGKTIHLTKSIDKEEKIAEAVKSVLGERAAILPDRSASTDNRLPSLSQEEASRILSENPNSEPRPEGARNDAR
jgi:PAS domain S-box-containing protein